MPVLPLLRATWCGWCVVRAETHATEPSLHTRQASITALPGAVRHGAGGDVPRLRARWRLLTVGRGAHRAEHIFLTASLRRLGYPARLVIGREAVPRGGSARYVTWVSVDGRVVSTGLPVTESHVPLAALPASAVERDDGC